MLKIVLGFFLVFFNVQGRLETTDVPVKMKVNIIKPYHGLAITDESGVVLDELLLDHGQIIKDIVQTNSETQKIFLVKRFDNGNSVDIGPGNLKATFSNGNDSEFVNLYKDGDLSSSYLKTKLEIFLKNSNIGRVKSVISKDILNGNVKHGKYYSQGINTLIVTYIP